MNKTRIKTLTMGVVFFLSGAGFLLGYSISNATNPPIFDQTELQTDEPGKTDPDNSQPVVPPTNDAEMVIKPDVPTDPDAIITPPAIDPEMAVDPSTRQPMNKEEMKKLPQPDPEKKMPNRKGRGFSDK